MDLFTLPNVAAYSAQIVVLVVLASALAWLLRIDAASVRYLYWRTLFAVCVLLPLLQGRQAPSPGTPGPDTPVEVAVALSPAQRAQAAPAIDWRAVVIPILAAGAAGRLLWLALNLVRLRRLRRSGVRAEESSVHQELCAVIGARPEIRHVPRLRQPVTFGLLRPVVLLPTGLAERSDDIQRAVLSHELFHVKRRDWGWLLVEEVVCALLWFNPAMWWLISRLHLAREVVVDELAVLATGRRRAYVEALIAFADETSLAPVAAFGGRAQLFNRIVLLSKESGMSARRLLVTVAVMLASLGAGTWHAVQAFPLVAVETQTVRQASPGPLEQRTNLVTAENPIPRRTNYEAPFYPAEAQAAGARGSVTLMITLDELGRVAEARRTGLMVESANPRATMRFNNTTPVDEIRFIVNQSREQSDTLRAIARAMEDAAFGAVQGWRYEPPARAPITFPVVVVVSDGRQPGEDTSGETRIGGGVNPEGAIRVGSTIKTPVKVRDVRPVYPPEARAANVSGLVVLEVRIGPEGDVEDARILRSIPLLDQAAVDAVSQWRYRPTLLNGKAVPVILTVTVNFSMQKPGEQPVEVAPEGRGMRGRGNAAAAPDTVTARQESPVVVKEVKGRYSREMLDAGVQGHVEMEVVIGTDGRVVDAQVLKGNEMLHHAALQAVRQWEFKPLREPATVSIEMTFTTRAKR